MDTCFLLWISDKFKPTWKTKQKSLVFWEEEWFFLFTTIQVMFWKQESDPTFLSILFCEYPLGIWGSFIRPTLGDAQCPSLLYFKGDIFLCALSGNLRVIKNQLSILSCTESGTKCVLGRYNLLCFIETEDRAVIFQLR